MSKKIPEHILKKFGATEAEIQNAKTKGKQERSFEATPERIKMSANECKNLCEQAGVEYKEKSEERVFRYIASDESVDRMGDVIKSDGWELDNFKKNPVILAFHGYQSFPVGAGLKAFVKDKKLNIDVLFAPEDVSKEAEQAFKLVSGGFMKGSSVGFNPKVFHKPDTKEIEKLGMDPGGYGIVFDEQELLELSIVPVPANANALQESVSKGLFKKEDLKGWYPDEILKNVNDSYPTAEKDLKGRYQDEILKNVNDSYPTAEEIAKAIIEQKAGATLSKKNKELIKKAMDALQELLQTNADDEPVIDIDLDTPENNESDLYSEDNIINID